MSERERELLQSLMPSLQSVVRMRARLEALESRARMNWAASESFAAGVIFIDEMGAVTA